MKIKINRKIITAVAAAVKTMQLVQKQEMVATVAQLSLIPVQVLSFLRIPAMDLVVRQEVEPAEIRI